MSGIISLLIISITIIPIVIIIALPSLLVIAGFLKIWYEIRERNMKKLASEYGLQFKSNTPGFKPFLYQIVWPYALKEDWKTNFIEGTLNGHKIFICDNLFSGPRFLGKPLNNENINRTVVQIDGQEIKGKEFKTQFLKFQDGRLTSVWELKRILKNV